MRCNFETSCLLSQQHRRCSLDGVALFFCAVQSHTFSVTVCAPEEIPVCDCNCHLPNSSAMTRPFALAGYFGFERAWPKAAPARGASAQMFARPLPMKHVTAVSVVAHQGPLLGLFFRHPQPLPLNGEKRQMARG